MSTPLPPLMLGENDPMVEHLLDRFDDIIALGTPRARAEQLLAEASQIVAIGDTPEERNRNLYLAQALLMMIAKPYRVTPSGDPLKSARSAGTDNRECVREPAPFADRFAALQQMLNSEPLDACLTSTDESEREEAIKARLIADVVRDIEEIQHLDPTADVAGLWADLASHSAPRSLRIVHDTARRLLRGLARPADHGTSRQPKALRSLAAATPTAPRRRLDPEPLIDGLICLASLAILWGACNAQKFGVDPQFVDHVVIASLVLSAVAILASGRLARLILRPFR